jgi:RNA polymerase sigma-70 factor (ECF subfamily)
LSGIDTWWTQVRQAYQAAGPEVRHAQERLLRRYSGAIRRYLLGALRNEDAAADMFQDFAYRFLHGDLRGADPQRGRFRDFVKGVLFHMVTDYYNKQQRQLKTLPPDLAAVEPEEPLADQDEAFRRSWRDELLARSWAALQAYEQQTGQLVHTVLRYRAEYPELRSPELAERLGALLGRPLTALAVRQQLHRAREKFGALLLEEVAQGLDSPSQQDLEDELLELELIEQLGPALEQRFQSD